MIKVPLKILNLNDDGFHILVEVVVFGQTFNAVVDTGASKTVFDKTIVEEFIDKESILLSDKLSTGLGTNSMESFTLTVPLLELAELKITNLEIAVLDLSMINIAYEKLDAGKIIGVIGGDIFMEYGAVINYPDTEIIFQNKIAYYKFPFTI